MGHGRRLRLRGSTHLDREDRRGTRERHQQAGPGGRGAREEAGGAGRCHVPILAPIRSSHGAVTFGRSMGCNRHANFGTFG
jgi:hypothetical protein